MTPDIDIAPSWTDDEPDFFAVRRELLRLRERTRRRRSKIIAVALLVTAGAVLFALRSGRRYQAQISVRVTEVIDFHLPRSSWTDRELRSFVTEVAFTNRVLTQVYQTHLAALEANPLRRANPVKGVERLREELGVEAVRNHIVDEAVGRTGPRSAYVVLRYAGPSEKLALAVLWDLAKPIMESSAKRRRLEAAQDIARASLMLEDAKQMLQNVRNQALERAGRPLPGAGSISPVRMVALESALNDAHIRVARFQEEMDAAQRRVRAEAQRPGIDFDIVRQNVERPLPRLPLLFLVGLCTLVLALPVTALVFGAAARTLDSPEDVRRLGIVVLGHLPHLAVPAPPRWASATARDRRYSVPT